MQAGDLECEPEHDLATATAGDNFDGQYDEDYDIDDSERQDQSGFETVPPQVASYLRYFHDNLIQGNSHEIQHCYESGFHKITEKFYAASPWPTAQEISEIVNHDSVFLTLYNELYFRHLFKLRLTLQYRIDSWKNYLDVFALILKKKNPADLPKPTSDSVINLEQLELPVHWVWDIVDEFIYQFQNFCQFRASLKDASPEDVELLKTKSDAWDLFGVLRTLQQATVVSGINATLDEERATGKLIVNIKQTVNMLGYMSLIGMLKVYTIIGDYHSGLKELSALDFQRKAPLFTRVTGCHITVYYHLGFSYMMLRRYSDAIKCFSNILVYISRIKQYQNRSYQLDQIAKRSEQMYSLLAICVGLCPQRIDEAVHDALMEKHGDKLRGADKREDSAVVFEELFSHACPKFVVISPPVGDASQSATQSPYNTQLQLFLKDLEQQEKHPLIRSYLQLYTTISVEKLAGFVKMQPDDCRQLLLSLKHKTRNRVRNFSAPPLSGERMLNTDVDFCLEGNMIHISDSKSAAPFSEFFIRHISKFEEVISNLQTL